MRLSFFHIFVIYYLALEPIILCFVWLPIIHTLVKHLGRHTYIKVYQTCCLVVNILLLLLCKGCLGYQSFFNPKSMFLIQPLISKSRPFYPHKWDFLMLLFTHYCPALPFWNGQKYLGDLFSSALSKLKIFHPSGSLECNDSNILQSLKLRIWVEKIPWNFTPKT